MSTRIVSLNAAVTAAFLLAAPGWVLAHGGIGGMHFGGGHFGGGHFGGGHFGGGHFGGGHFGGGHHFGGGGWGGGGGHFNGGNIGGGFRGGSIGGGNAGGMVGGAIRGGGSGGSHFGQTHLGGAVRTHMSGGAGRSGTGSIAHRAGGGAGGMVRAQSAGSNPNSFVTRHVSTFAHANRGGTHLGGTVQNAGGASSAVHGSHHSGSGAGGQHVGNGNGNGGWGNGNWGNGGGGLWGAYYYPRGGLAWGIVSSILNNLYFGYGYGGYGYGYGYGSYGCGYGYNSNCYYGSNGLGGYASPGYYLYTVAGNAVVANTPLTSPVVTADGSTTVAQQPAAGASSTTSGNASAYADDAEAAFKAGDFKGAEYALRHAVVDDPQNPVLVMMLSQALFANGKYDESAGAAQNAMQQLPKDQWGVVVSNYKDLYSGNQPYTDQLRALEKAAKDKSDAPGISFLLGFHYGYLGYPKEAIERLDKTIKLAPRDEVAKQLREEMRAKLPKPATPEAEGPAGKT